MSEELDALRGEAAAVDVLIAPVQFEDVEAQQAAEQAQQIAGNEAAELSAMLSIVTGIFAPVFPSLGKIYTPDTVQRLANSFVPVMVKRGWSTGGILGRFGEELAFCAVAFPVALATYAGVKADIAAAQPEQKEQGRIEGVSIEPAPQDQPQIMARG
ncbi:MAG: hypothetical protein Q7U78_05955 [Gallionella sp.]|nr:hypothetical protein [Gallionella sp.]